MEKEIIGFSITNNPLARYKKIIDKKVTKKIGDVSLEDLNKDLILAGIISGKKLIKTKKNNSEMAFIKIFDETGSIEVVVFPRTFAAYKDFLNLNQVIIFKGKVSEKMGTVSVLMSIAKKL